MYFELLPRTTTMMSFVPRLPEEARQRPAERVYPVFRPLQ